jgi:Fe-S-cluster containining protein
MKTIIQIQKITEYGEIHTDMATDISNPCQNCGACCNHFRISFYQGECDIHGGTVPIKMVTPITPFLVAMKGSETGGRCSALTGTIGNNTGCSIYHNRPTPCRAFNVWDELGNPNPKCQSLRLKAGLKPLKSIENM